MLKVGSVILATKRFSNMKKIAQAVLIILILSSSHLYASECEGPTKLVKITVEQIATSPPVYLFKANNFHESSIVNFRLGIGERREMKTLPDNIPISVGSPQGWEGQYIFVEETIYMHIFWLAKHEFYRIATDASLNGFTLVMPEQRKSKVPLYGPDGELSVLLDIKKAPFNVRFEDGKCVWGRVEEK